MYIKVKGNIFKNKYVLMEDIYQTKVAKLERKPYWPNLKSGGQRTKQSRKESLPGERFDWLWK